MPGDNRNRDRRTPIPFLPGIGFDVPEWLQAWCTAVGSRLQALYVDPDPPAGFPLVNATRVSSGIILTWTQVPKARGYRVYRGVNGDITTAAAIQEEGPLCRYCYDAEPFTSGVNPNGNRSYWISALGQPGVEGPLSPVIFATPVNQASTGTAYGRGANAGAYGVAIGYGAENSLLTGSQAYGYEAENTSNNEVVFGASNANSFVDKFRIALGANGQFFSILSTTELTVINAAASTSTAIVIPANTILKGVAVYTVTTIPTAATYTVTGAVSLTTFSTAPVSATAGSSNKGNAAGAYYNSAAQAILITPNAVPVNTTGSVRVVIIYEDITPPTS